MLAHAVIDETTEMLPDASAVMLEMPDTQPDITNKSKEFQQMKTNRIDPKSLDLDFLKEEFNRFRSELAGIKGKLGANAAEALDQMGAYLDGGNLSSRLSSLEAEFDHLAGKVKDSGKVAVDRLETEVSARPLASIAVAFGVGLLAAQFFSRK